MKLIICILDATVQIFFLVSLCRDSRSQIFYKIGVLKSFKIFIGKLLCWSLFLIKMPLFNKGLKVCNFIEKRLQHRFFPVKFAKFLRTPFFIEHLRWLLLPVGTCLEFQVFKGFSWNFLISEGLGCGDTNLVLLHLWLRETVPKAEKVV